LEHTGGEAKQVYYWSLDLLGWNVGNVAIKHPARKMRVGR